MARLQTATAGAAALSARWSGSDGRFTVTVEADERNARYQGIVPLSGDSLARSLEAYFASSEQLPTRVLLAADDTRVAGLLLQKLPDAGASQCSDPDAAWQEAERGMQRLAPGTLLGAPVEPLLLRSFPAHDLRLFRGAAGALRVPLQHGPGGGRPARARGGRDARHPAASRAR